MTSLSASSDANGLFERAGNWFGGLLNNLSNNKQLAANDQLLCAQLQSISQIQHQEALLTSLKQLVNALHRHLNFGPPDNVYIAMFLINQQHEAMKLAKRIIRNPKLIEERCDEVIARIDMLITELPETWADAISPYVNDLQLLLSMSQRNQDAKNDAFTQGASL